MQPFRQIPISETGPLQPTQATARNVTRDRIQRIGIKRHHEKRKTIPMRRNQVRKIIRYQVCYSMYDFISLVDITVLPTANHE